MQKQAITTQNLDPISLYRAFTSLQEEVQKVRLTLAQAIPQKELDEDTLDALDLKKTREEDSGEDWIDWKTFKKQLKEEGLL